MSAKMMKSVGDILHEEGYRKVADMEIGSDEWHRCHRRMMEILCGVDEAQRLSSLTEAQLTAELDKESSR